MSIIKDYILKLKSKGFRESELDLSSNRTFGHITILDHATLENETMTLYCELLDWENDEAAIFVVISTKGDI